MIEQIKEGELDNLSISMEDMGDGEVAVLLYTPDMGNKMEHHHIELTSEEAMKLYNFLRRNIPSIVWSL